MPDFDGSFKSLLVWAFDIGLLPRQIQIPVNEILN